LSDGVSNLKMGNLYELNLSNNNNEVSNNLNINASNQIQFINKNNSDLGNLKELIPMRQKS